jgi:antitoxin YefM
MTTLNASEARQNLYRLPNKTAEAHEPFLITGRRANALLVAEEDWRAL